MMSFALARDWSGAARLRKTSKITRVCRHIAVIQKTIGARRWKYARVKGSVISGVNSSVYAPPKNPINETANPIPQVEVRPNLESSFTTEISNIARSRHDRNSNQPNRIRMPHCTAAIASLAGVNPKINRSAASEGILSKMIKETRPRKRP